MDRWKSTARKNVRHRESQKGEDQRWRRSEGETMRREKMQVREKVGKSRNNVFFHCFVAPEGGRVGSLKRRVWELAGQRRDEKLHALVVRSTFGGKKCQSTTCSEHFWKWRCGKSARREAYLEVKSVKTRRVRSTFGS